MAKANKNLYVGIAALVAVVAIVIGVVVVKNNGGSNNGGDSGNNGSSSQTSFADELKNVDVMVEFGDYDAMETLSKDIQNGLATGKVVKIDGTVSHPMSFYSIVQRNSADTASIGTRFVIEGEEAYPEDKDRVVITGKVVELEPLVYVIKTTKDFIKVQE